MGNVRIRNFLKNEWVDGAGDVKMLINPATEEPVAESQRGGEGTEAGIRFAREVGGPALRKLTFPERAELLSRVGKALTDAREKLIASSMANGGCTRGDAKFDVDGAAFVINQYAELGKTLPELPFFVDGEGEQLGRSPRLWGQHVYVPRHGVAVLINAFNFPTWGFAEKMACAILAGVPVVTKPATATSLTAFEAAQAIAEHANLPPGAFSFMCHNPDDILAALGPQDILSFTGSADTGAKVKSHPNILEQGVRIGLEADSLNAAVLAPDVDLGSDTGHLFAREVARELTQKAGQKCTCVRRILVPEAKVDEVIEKLGEQFADYPIGNPTTEGVRLGPLASKSQLSSAHEGLKELRAEADVVFGKPDEPVKALGAPEGKGYFLSPVLLKAKDPASLRAVHTTEVFASAATLIPYDGTVSQAATLVSRGRGALMNSVYSDDKTFLSQILPEMGAFQGRMYLASQKIADQAPGSGTVLPQLVHGGPGRAGDSEELGGTRGVKHYMQRTAVQGARPWVERITHSKKS